MHAPHNHCPCGTVIKQYVWVAIIVKVMNALNLPARSWGGNGPCLSDLRTIPEPDNQSLSRVILPENICYKVPIKVPHATNDPSGTVRATFIDWYPTSDSTSIHTPGTNRIGGGIIEKYVGLTITTEIAYTN